LRITIEAAAPALEAAARRDLLPVLEIRCPAGIGLGGWVPRAGPHRARDYGPANAPAAAGGHHQLTHAGARPRAPTLERRQGFNLIATAAVSLR
jgi:hypothetical protein